MLPILLHLIWNFMNSSQVYTFKILYRFHVIRQEKLTIGEGDEFLLLVHNYESSLFIKINYFNCLVS